MIREVDLVDYYLPPFMQTYKEPVATLNAEQPEFNLVWKAADKVLYNRFILTADEDGISRFERMLNIYPTADDTLESRRFRIQNRWFNTIPYTMKALVQKLKILCPNTDFTIEHNFECDYTLTLNTNLEEYGKVDELEQILNSMIPCNIVIKSNNSIIANVPLCENYIAGATTSSMIIEAANYTEQIVFNDKVLNLYIPNNDIDVQSDMVLNLSTLNNYTDVKLEIAYDISAVPIEY